ncbi:MAG: hypothetical protein LHW64_05045 [Candidatus Cloacimonetes bacterium]|jgi:hypothetical protein|nr:hypothetical protein [Candidatus Cloacimonadota bacterium]MCB5287149.1 hypothetical protein [Candidatus Cloacimonadota bacterium]MCK9185486.1 hypothetical protein [Candidatus Cloacimonadota bacterium]MCK9584644.1 hypothetical protein [Candidatus Cloacimonadota bacterium]MDY0229470.1 hypothetical protein [Candidatus Cloacimonadaceae bacterium]
MRKALLASLLCMLLTGALALSSYGTSVPMANDTVDPSLSILSPNGGEAWYIGDTKDILWEASDPNLLNNSVNLWYSLNSSTDYLPIAEMTDNDGTEPWLMPSTQSYNARVKTQVSDSFGNSSEISSAGFSITYVPPAEPTGLMVDISNNVDAVINWQAVTHTIPPYNSDITPDGYIVLYNESPYEHDEHFFYFLTETNSLNYTHQRVACFRDQIFYRIVAYKDYDGRMENVLAEAKANADNKLSLAELKSLLHAEGAVK